MVILVANTGQYNPPDSLHPFGLLDVTGLSWNISPPFQLWFLRMPGINELAVWLPLGQLHMLHLRLRKSTSTYLNFNNHNRNHHVTPHRAAAAEWSVPSEKSRKPLGSLLMRVG